MLYFKNPNDFGKLSYSENSIIQDTLNYTIIPYEQQINYENPEVYDSSFSPICIGFVNKDIKENYIVTDIKDNLLYDGSLLKRGNISLSNINCSFSFDLNIINQMNKHYKANITIDIPLKSSDTNSTIYDGFIKQEITNLENLKFYKYVPNIDGVKSEK